MAYQYVTVRMPLAQDKDREQVWTDRLNAVAAEGWRLVTITENTGKGFTVHLATFEREVPNA